MKQKIILIILPITLLVLIITISYNLSLNKFYNPKDHEITEDYRNKSEYVSYANINEVLPLDTTITTYLKMENNGEEFNVKSFKLKDFSLAQSGKMTLKDLEDYFNKSNYKLSKRINNEIIFIKTIKYEPNKFYIGPTEEGYVGLFKTDSEGNMEEVDISNEVTLKKISTLPNNDRELISSYHFKFDTFQEAIEEISSISS